MSFASAHALTWPRLLKPGGTVGICSPSSASSPENLTSGVRALEARGYRVIVAPNAAELNTDLEYLAGSDAQRADDVNYLLANPEVDLILCARGGYGAARILDRIDYELARRDPKPLVGYSDITVLNLALAVRAGIVSFSGIMATTYHDLGGAGLDTWSEQSLWQMVGAEDFPRTLTHPADFAPWQRHGDGTTGSVRGPVYAVCLSLLVSLLATPYLPSLEGAILIIEDIGEHVYRIDRLLTQLRLAGILNKLSAVLIGSFNGTSAAGDAYLIQKVPQLVRNMTPPHIPVASGIPYGHIARRWTVPCGAVGTVDFDGQTLTFAG